MDTDKWGAVGLFVLGVATVVGGTVLGRSPGLDPVVSVAVTLSGFAAFGFATALYVRWGTGTVTRQRVAVVLATFLGVGIATVSVTVLEGQPRVASVVAGMGVAYVGWYLNRRLVAAKDVVTRDERVELLSYKAGWRASQVLLAVVVGWFYLRTLTAYHLPVGTMLIALVFVGIGSRVGFYRYYTRRA